MYDDAPLSTDAVVRLLREVWGIDVDVLDYERLGYGSYHWCASARDDARWFVTADRADPEQPTREAYALARRLADDGLELVRAPVRHLQTGVTYAADDFLLSVWPWLEGRSSHWGEHVSRADAEATLRSVRRLHDHAAGDPVDALVEDWSLPGRERLVDFLASLPAFRGTGPYAEEVCSRVRASRDRMHRLQCRHDELVSKLECEPELVVTHGEPHAANVVHTGAGAVLIDWDTVRWAPRERDLWMLVDHAGWREAYGPANVRGDALELYRHRWTLTEIALFVPALAEATRRTPDLEIAIQELRGYLEGLPAR